MTPRVKRPKKKPGPKPDRLKIEGDWESAARRALSRPEPSGGWPKRQETDDAKRAGRAKKKP